MGGFVGDVACGERDGVRGLYATKDVPKGTLLLSVPEACCIAADEPPQCGLSLRAPRPALWLCPADLPRADDASCATDVELRRGAVPGHHASVVLRASLAMRVCDEFCKCFL